MATFGPPVRSSEGRNDRPSAGATPRMLRKLPETRAALTTSGAPLPVRASCSAPPEVDAGFGVGAGGGAELVHVDGRCAAGQDDELLRVCVTQRAQQHGAHDGEECGVGADAERDGEHDGRGEAGTFGDHSRGEAKVLPQCAEKSSS